MQIPNRIKKPLATITILAAMGTLLLYIASLFATATRAQPTGSLTEVLYGLSAFVLGCGGLVGIIGACGLTCTLPEVKDDHWNR